MKFALTCLGMGVVLLLAACAFRSSDMSAPVIPEPPPEPSELPLQTPLQAGQAPIVPLEDTIHVGADVAAAPASLPQVALHGDARVSHGTVTDGVGAAALTAYLEADAAALQEDDEDDGMTVDAIPDGLLLRFAATPPTVYVADGTPPGLVDETVRAVQAINAALPEDWQLGFSRNPATADNIGSPDGKIVVRFALQIEWPRGFVSPTGKDVGLAIPSFSIVPTEDPEMPFRVEIVAGRVFVDHTQTKGIERLGVIAHELIHLLGRSHVDAYRFPGTIMVDGGSKELTEHILHPLDREALLAVYGRLEPGTVPGEFATELGDWSDTSLHVQGTVDIEDDVISFGTALRNGLSQPWATGPSPHANLEDNTELSGSVSWSGRLLGLTPDAETVAGTADLSVNLGTLTGTVDFTGLEQWAADAPPGELGTGAIWNDGDLRYDIEVRGNTFVQSGGDSGTVTGAFFGPAHEGMGGVLERYKVLEHEKLSAGFGGKR